MTLRGLDTVASAALLAAFALACGQTADSKRGDAPPPPQRARAVQLARVAPRTLASDLHVTGTLAPDEQVTVSVKVSGRLASIAIDLGSVVERGQPIAQVESTDYQLKVEQAASALAQARALLGLPADTDDAHGEAAIDIEKTSLVQEAQATLEEARANLERSRALVEQRFIAQAELDTAQANFVRAQSGVAKAQDEIRNRQATLRQRSFELRAARQQLTDALVRSPLAGVVQERLARAGEYLAAGASVATVVRIDPLRLRVEVPERDAQFVRVGQAVRVSVDGDDTLYPGRIARLAPALTEHSRSLVIEAEVANPGSLRPGSFVRAAIVMDDAHDVTVVPTSAIVTFAGIEKVITVKDGKAVEKQIETARRSGPWTEVVSGIALGDAVVLEPGNLQQGQSVSVADAR